MRISASEVAHVTGGTLVGPEVEANGMAFDTRALVPGQAFVAIVGERDGHDFLSHAASVGAAFALVNKGRSSSALTCVEVDDTVQALASIGNTWRKKLNAVENRVVAITGSAGKTSTKNFVAAILSSGFAHSFSAEKSLNNDIGVPVTIVNAPDNCDALVLEMGMRGFGEIARLCAIAEPTIGIVTNVGDAHGERVGGAEGIAKAKGELIAALPSHGIAVLNADDPRVINMSALTKAQIISFGEAINADVRCVSVAVDEFGCAIAQFTNGGESVVAKLRVAGAHMVMNAAAAIAVGIACGMNLKQCVGAIETVEPEPGRMQWHTTKTGQRLLNDSYNANSSSMRAALETLGSVPAQRRVAVLGKMSEVTDAQSAHSEIPMFASMRGIEVVALETDLYGSPALTLEQVLSYLSDTTIDAILVKGSRAAATERVVEELIS